MEPPKSEQPKMPDMVMCGDHPSFTKTELNVKEQKTDSKDKEKPDERMSWHKSYAKLSPTASHTDRPAEQRARSPSEHALKLLEARRRAHALELPQRPEPDGSSPGNRALVQAALGSFRWPPYLLAVWAAALVLTHALHGAAGLLERALPALKKFCQYVRAWTDEAWRNDTELSGRACPLALACLTGLSYGLFFCLFAMHSVVVWAIEPLCSEPDEKRAEESTRVTNYVDELTSKTNLKQ